MTRKLFTAGQEVWIKDGGKSEVLRKAIVSKVGRKYVTVGRDKYDLETHREVRDIGAAGHLYVTEQAHEDALELIRNKHEIRSIFDYSSGLKITLEQTREILSILKGGSGK